MQYLNQRMSGLAGLWRADGQPAAREELEGMLSAMPHRAASGWQTYVDGPFALAATTLQGTPETRNACAFAGRLDNAASLRNQLGLEAGAGDGALVLAAVERWRDEAHSRLLGDFAYAAWEARNARLVCARDTAGLRPFYYAWDGRVFRFASEMGALLAGGHVSRAPNEGMAGEYLACAITQLEETLYQAIRRLPPGHALTLEDGRLHIGRYWRPEPNAILREKEDQEYQRLFLETFREAVRCRLSSDAPVGLDLSGGLDSSAVVCMAGVLAKEGRLPCPGLEAFSLVFPGQPCDESSYIASVVQAWPLKHHAKEPELPDAAKCLEFARRFADFPGHPNGLMFVPLLREAAARDVRITVSGIGGDDWWQGAGLSSLRPLLRTLVPSSMRRALRRARGLPGLPPWIQPDFAKRIHLRDRLEALPPAPAGADPCWARVYQTGLSGWKVHALECEERQSAAFGLDLCCPFEDRRLVELALAFPEAQRRRGGQTKYVLREALRGVLPEQVRLRRDKAVFTAPVTRTILAPAMRELLAGTNLRQRGWVLDAEVQAQIRQLEDLGEQGAARFKLRWPLWMALGLESWLSASF